MRVTIIRFCFSGFLWLCFHANSFAQAGLNENIDMVHGYCIGKGYTWEVGSIAKGGPLDGWKLIKSHGDSKTITFCFNSRGVCEAEVYEFDTELAYRIQYDKVMRAFKQVDSDHWVARHTVLDRNVKAENVCQKTPNGYSCMFYFTFDRPL